jgi:hypothetical protein
MRLLIYLLAMLTGFSSADAARPVSAVPASVDAAAGQAYRSAAVRIADTLQIAPKFVPPFTIVRKFETPSTSRFFAIQLTTPVLRHDLILG